MGNFNKGNKREGGNGGGWKSDFKKKPFGNSRGGDGQMFKATCSECQKTCEVPFRPSNGKPVFCNECFSNRKEMEGRGGRGDFTDRGGRRDFNDKFTPAPTFKPAGSNDDTKKQLSEMGYKLDKLIAAMDRLADLVRSTPKSSEIIPVVKLPKVEAPKEEAKKASKKVIAKKVAVKKVAEKKVVAKKSTAKKKK